MNIPPFSRLIVSVSALFSVHMATLLGGILLPIAIARLAGVEALGMFSAAAALGLLLTTIIDWGYETRTPLIVRAVLNRSASNRGAIITRHVAHINRIKGLLWVLSVGVCLAIMVPTVLKRGLDEPVFVFIIYALWALARAQMATYSAALRGVGAFTIIARGDNICSLLAYLLSTISIGLGIPLFLALVWLCIAELCKIVIFRRALYQQLSIKHMWKLAPFHQVQFLVRYRAEYFRACFRPQDAYISLAKKLYRRLRSQLPFVAFQALGIAESRAGIFALAVCAASEADVGYFGAAMRFIIALRTFSGALFQTVLPSFAASVSLGTTAHSSKETKILLRRFFVLGTVVACSGSALLFIMAEPLIIVVYGNEFAPAISLLRIIAALFVLQTYIHLWEALFIAYGQERIVNTALLFALGLFAIDIILQSLPEYRITAERVAWAVLHLNIGLFSVYTMLGIRMLRRSLTN